MGLVSFWSTIAGPKVKEITPQCDTPWLDRGRPTTSSGVRFGRKRPGSTGDDLDKRPTTANAEKKFKRIGRSLSRPRKALPFETEIPPTPPAIEIEEKKAVPDLPAIPSNFSREQPDFVHPPTREAPKEPTREEPIERPSTAVTSECLNDMHIFELPADPLPILPATCYENPLIRPRSKSPPCESTATKGGHWFRIGAAKNKALPPAPPPSAPLPPLPFEGSSNQTSGSPKLPTRIDHDRGHSLRRSQSSTSRSESRPAFVRSRSENNFLAGGFPAVPSLVHDADMTPESSTANSEVSSVCSPAHDQHIFVTREKRVPGSIDVSTARTHQYKDSGIGTPKSPFTPSGIKRWTREGQVSEDDEGVDVTGWTEADLKEWDRSLGQLEPMNKEERYGGAGLMRSLEVNAEKIRTLSSHSNDQALAELQFGVLK